MEKYIIQESEIIPEKVEYIFRESFEYNDVNLKNGMPISKFVGFIIQKDKILISFPKQFYSRSGLNHIQTISEKQISLDSKLLFETIKKAIIKKSRLGISFKNDIESNFPFDSFFSIYRYYLNYGLSKNEYKSKKFGYNGKIDWKKTIEKSPILVSNKNVIYSPLVINKNFEVNNFLSKCMAYAINSTSEKLSMFMKIKKIELEYNDFNWENNTEVLNILKNLKGKVYKDFEKKLIKDLIDFFSNTSHTSDTLKIKIHTFYYIWEDMVKEYLNNYFLDIVLDKYRQQYTFIMGNNKNKEKSNFSKKLFYTDVRGKDGFVLEPDHYLEKKDKVYIFDSKYRNKMYDLDYKQISYQTLIKKNLVRKNFDSLYNALILPTHKEKSFTKNHYIQSLDYTDPEDRIIIIEQYFNMKLVMKKYLSL